MSNLVSAANREGKWTRFWRFLREFDEAIGVSEVESAAASIRISVNLAEASRTPDVCLWPDPP
jgi:hypothetical protein